MGISAPIKSAQFTDYSASPKKFIAPNDWGAKLRTSHCSLTFTAAGYTTAATGDIFLIHLPAGKVRLFVDKCRLVCPQGSTNSDLDIGYAAYVGEDGVPVVAANNALADSLDVGGGALDQTLPLPAGGVLELSSQSGVDIVCSFDTANSPASGVLTLDLLYSQGN